MATLLRGVLPGLATLIWGLWLLLGAVAIASVRSQNVEGYPNGAQITYYLGFPALAVLLGAALFVGSLRFKGFWLQGLSVLLGLAALLFLFMFTGGV